MPWIKGDTLWIRSGQEDSGLILVLRKSLGKAVVRNRLKRRLRHICRHIEHPGSLVVLPRTRAVNTPFRLLECELRELVERVE